MSIKADKYLSFSLLDEIYALKISLVIEILAWRPAIMVPRCQDWVHGIINIRGKIIPVIDLNMRLGLDSSEHCKTTCIIVVEVESSDESKVLMGFVVDAVLDVLFVEDKHREESPLFGDEFNSEFVESVIRMNEITKTLLNLPKIFEDKDILFKEAS
ncbi:chemotaxis protein CheW [bacterium]|nr:chemotaxis protein CheW [bacterium]